MINLLKNYRKHFTDYIYDSSVDIKERAFILFSTTVLFALFAAVPCGLIMQEPLIATISTFVSAIFFTLYVIYSFKKKRIARAKVVISIILVFIFLPAMLFTNGGVEGGAPIWLLLGTIYIALILDGRLKAVMLILNIIFSAISWIIGYVYPDIVVGYSRGGNYFDTIAGLFIVGTIIYVMISFQKNLFRKEEEQKNLRRLFEQTASSLVNAIDAKDEYTHGHSSRVAEYSRKIAEVSGMSEAECNEIYYVALLHDVGKIGIPESIINKRGKLTDEEYNTIKQHPVMGVQILHGITEYPNLSIGAHYHHERYDGKGYPERLKGEDIPKLARIIAVADAYDAMTSKRSYRDSIPQQTVREEIIKGSGTQFDPVYAKIMQFLIDSDTDYNMREKQEVKELSWKTGFYSKEFGSEVSEGIHITPEIRKIKIKCIPDSSHADCLPGMVLFDSLDQRIHDNERDIKNLCYFEFAYIWFDGRYECKGARKFQVEESESKNGGSRENHADSIIYDIEAVKCRDHIMLKIDNGIKLITMIVALPDSSRYAYIGLTGEHCYIEVIDIEKMDGCITEDYIPRIAEEVSFINGPAGDIPNVQIDGYRTASSESITIKDGLRIRFHIKSLPNAWLIWHCPFLSIFYSDDKRMEGESYKEYALIRFDGEEWEADRVAQNKLIVNKTEEFEGWDAWKQVNREGYDCSVTFRITDNVITTTTENSGINIKNITTIFDMPREIYVSITGDQCAITNIRVERE